ncbi:hypothetical protein VCV18_004130 [Metarhizium anisopliae]
MVPGRQKRSRMVRTVSRDVTSLSKTSSQMIGSLLPTTTIRACPTHKEFAEFGSPTSQPPQRQIPRDDPQLLNIFMLEPASSSLRVAANEN